MENLLKEYQLNEVSLLNIEEEISKIIGNLLEKQKEIQLKNDEIKEQIKISMEEQEIKKFENDFISITYIAPTTRNTIDSSKLKTKYEDVYNDCIKISNVKSSVRIKIKEAEVKENIETKEIDFANAF